MESSESSPCSNVPLKCPLCPPKDAPAVWRYNLEYHIRQAHPHGNLTKYASLFTLSNAEIDFIDSIWSERLTVTSRRAGKTKASSGLQISEAHTSTRALAPRYELFQSILVCCVSYPLLL